MDYIESYKKVVDHKYNSLVCKLAEKLTHPHRMVETSLGNLIADAFAKIAECDVMFVGAGSIRVKKFGPMVTLGDLRTCFPYDDTLRKFSITGKQLKKIFSHIMRKENRNSEGECYQVSSGIEAIYNDLTKSLESLKYMKKPVDDKKQYRICLQSYSFGSCANYLNITQKELLASGQGKVVSTSAQGVLEEYLRNHQNISRKVEGRLIYK